MKSIQNHLESELPLQGLLLGESLFDRSTPRLVTVRTACAMLAMANHGVEGDLIQLGSRNERIRV